MFFPYQPCVVRKHSGLQPQDSWKAVFSGRSAQAAESRGLACWQWLHTQVRNVSLRKAPCGVLRGPCACQASWLQLTLYRLPWSWAAHGSNGSKGRCPTPHLQTHTQTPTSHSWLHSGTQQLECILFSGPMHKPSVGHLPCVSPLA